MGSYWAPPQFESRPAHPRRGGSARSRSIPLAARQAQTQVRVENRCPQRSDAAARFRMISQRSQEEEVGSK